MTLDEAIKHCEEVADGFTEQGKCEECAAEHRQLANWLKELKDYRERMTATAESEPKIGHWMIENDKEQVMNILREIEMETDHLQIGDRIKVNYAGEKHYATAIQQRGDAMLFLTDDCLDDAMQMNLTNTVQGGWKGSELRKRLQDIADITDIKDQLVPFENGDLLTLLSIQEVFGVDEHLDKCDGQIEWLKDRCCRIARRKGEEYPWGWLRSIVAVTLFASVTYSGSVGGYSASNAFGVRPAFMIKNTIAEDKVDK